MSDTMSNTMSDTMNVKIECDMPYLRAIQQIPGNTPAKKFSWIGRLAARDQKAGGDRDKVPQELQSLLQVEAAIKQNTPEYEKDIKSALQSEDSMINRRALKASWFFNGSCKKTINAEYFCNDIFPNVSLRTRTSIINKFASKLIGRDPVFAEELFTAITSAYDIKTALPLIIACRESFIYDTIVEKKLILPYTIVKKIYCINSHLAARYLILLKPNNIDNPFAIGIQKYTKIVKKLAKKHVEYFVTLCVTHASNLNIILSKKSAGIFLKEAKIHLIAHPKIFFFMLPLKMISANIMETIFPKLLPDERSGFNTTNALDCLKFYFPKQKKIELLFKTYKDKYNAELLDNLYNVTPALLQILPTEKRIELARSKINHSKIEQDDEYTIQKEYIMRHTMERTMRHTITYTMKSSYKQTWICYYSTKEAIPLLMESIQKSSGPWDRADYIGQMMYCCKVNDDNEMLAEVIKYIIARHKNERSDVCRKIIEYFAEIYEDAVFLDEQLQSLVFDMINLFYVKHGVSDKRIIASLTQFKLTNKLPITNLMQMLIELNIQEGCEIFNILEQYPVFERKCLETIGDILSDKYFSSDKIEMTTKQQKYPLIQFIKAIYAFNKRCKTLYPNVKHLTITSYPNLLYDVSAILKSNDYFRNAINDILKKNEPTLYYSIISKMDINMETNIADLTSKSGLNQLKRNPLNILNNWEKYLEKYKKHLNEKYFTKNMQKFIRIARWHQDIPIKFAERCIEELNGDKHKNRSSLIILGILLHGDTLTKIIKLLVSNITVNVSKQDDRDSCLFVEIIPHCIKLSNPPVSFDIMIKLSEGDYLSTALVALINISRRSSLKKVLLFAQQLISMRVGARKHGIRLLSSVLSMQEYINHLDNLWKTEKNFSIRQIIFDEVEQFFSKNPCAETWSLYCKIVSMATVEDSEIILSKMQLDSLTQRQLNTVAPNAITQYIELWFSTITRFQNDGMTNEELNRNLNKFVNILNKEDVVEFVPDEIADNIIKKYLFHSENVIASLSRRFALLYIFTKDQNKFQTRKTVLIETIRSATMKWNEPHPLKFRFYPINYTIHYFIIEFANKCVRSRYQQSFNFNMIDDMLHIFKSYLLPTQDMESYLMLEYTKLLLKCTSEKEEDAFGLRLGLFVPSLIDIFTPLLVHFMATTLDQFLRNAYIKTNDENTENTIRCKIMNGLIHSEHIPSIVLAVILLSFERRDEIYDDLISKFMHIDHPAVTIILHNYLNKEYQ
ncbi:uncharacterized protein [Linepithema humile]|uniref:uncharacterized protein n=1 Tax=Linepithema humile TaxID=83485 RepID=UPI00351ED510